MAPKVQFLFALVILIRAAMYAQSPVFVSRSSDTLFFAGKPFYAIGVNSYYLQNIAAFGDTTHIDEIFREASALGLTTIRTWGFFDSPNTTNPAVIQLSPGVFQQSGLLALDLVVERARAYGIRLIISLVNNWEDYGGMNQYVAWYSSHVPSKAGAYTPQRIITGVNGRQYKLYVTNTLTHDDFYVRDTIKQWYKQYVSTIVQRTNPLTGIQYKDEPAILAWEMANEPRSSDPTGQIVVKWMDEMSTFIKSIDKNHLVSSGEEGLDISPASYSSIDSYNGQHWLFDGSGGVSFGQHLSLPHVDLASIHCYPDQWGLTPSQGVIWLRDHQYLATRNRKPLVVGECGMRRNAHLFFEALFNESYFSNTTGALAWQLVYDGRPNNDGYAFSCPDNNSVCSTLHKYGERFSDKSAGQENIPSTSLLLQNYPNPFNSITVISYDLSSEADVHLDVYDFLGQRVQTLVSWQQQAGNHAVLFDAASRGSGSYVVRLMTRQTTATKKILLIK
ncbi:MAG: T9SS type A sorting domain-containing protein [Ignavibacteria bacterium]|nr:T9SS type A sorting domain-containing protein [Ignavibacteria bacterium]MBI3765554.1 T9SS type A sorting domain-containing protein [Ignavibacteriales bacterium]